LWGVDRWLPRPAEDLDDLDREGVGLDIPGAFERFENPHLLQLGFHHGGTQLPFFHQHIHEAVKYAGDLFVVDGEAE
jgi:hypothetical protein